MTTHSSYAQMPVDLLKKLEEDYIQKEKEIRERFTYEISENQAKLLGIRNSLYGLSSDHVEIDGVIFSKDVLRRSNPIEQKKEAYKKLKNWYQKITFILDSEGYPMTSTEIINLMKSRYNEVIEEKSTKINVAITTLMKTKLGRVKLYNKGRYYLREWIENGELKKDYLTKLEEMIRVPEN